MRLGFVLIAGILLGSSLARAQQPREVPRFAAGVALVTVDAVVLDGDGALVRGLGAEDFALFEDGHEQPIASFEAVDVDTPAADRPTGGAGGSAATDAGASTLTGRPIVLLVDDMSLAPSNQVYVQRAIERFVREGLRDGDELIFATASGDVWWSARIPGGREDLLALAARVRGRRLSDTAPDAMSEWEAFRIVQVEGMEDGARATDPGPQGPPSFAVEAPTYVPGANMSERLRHRFLLRGVCDPVQPVAACYAMVRSRAQQVDVRRRNRTRDTMAVVDRAIFALTGIRGRKSLLLLTEGFLNDPDLGLVQEVAGRCREANIAVYSVDVRGLIAGNEGLSATTRDAPYAAELGVRRAEVMELEAAGAVGLAEDTGGFAVRHTNDLAGGVARAAQESRVHYLLGYAPPAGKSALDWRKLRVEVKRPGLRVRARKGYTLRSTADIAAAAGARLAAERGEDPPVPLDVARVMVNPLTVDGLLLRAMPYVLEERVRGTARTVFAVEVDTRRLANIGPDEAPRAALSLVIASTHRDSGKTVHVAELVRVDDASAQAWGGWLVLSRALDVPPGVNQARVVVRDEFLGRIGALTVRFVVPPLSGLRVSSPLITDRLLPASPYAPARPTVIARRAFAAVDPLYCQFEVFGAARGPGRPARVQASVELRRTGDEVVRRSTLQSVTSGPDGRLVHFVAIPIAGLAEGDYEVLVSVEETGTGRSVSRAEPLAIMRGGSG